MSIRAGSKNSFFSEKRSEGEKTDRLAPVLSVRKGWVVSLSFIEHVLINQQEAEAAVFQAAGKRLALT